MGGEAGGCMCQGTSFRGPTVAWLSFHVCLQKHISLEGGREKEKGRWQRCHCYFPMCPQPGGRGGGSVSTSNCLSLPCFTPSSYKCRMYTVRSTDMFPFHFFFIIYERQDYFRGRRGRQNAQCSVCIMSFNCF